MDDVTLLRWMVIALVPLLFVLATYRARAHRAGGAVSRQAEGPVILVGLRLAAILAFALLLWWLIAPDAPILLPASIPMALRYAGVAMAWSGLLLLWWVFHSLGLNLTDTVAVRAKATLVQHGPYRWVRHPLYTVAALILFGLVLAAASLSMLFAVLAWHAAIAMRTPIEEAKLLERFGDDYRDYMRRTGRYLPRLGPPRDPANHGAATR